MNPKPLDLDVKPPWNSVRCSHCGEWKPRDEFYEDRRNRNGRKSYCRDCAAAAQRTRRANREGGEPRMDGEKPCGQCGQTKPRTEFSPNKMTYDGRQTHCRRCNNEIDLIRRTGATHDWKALRWALNDGKCPCGLPIEHVLLGGVNHRADDAVVDHIEVDGQKLPQGVLHSRCNRAIGLPDHDADRLDNLAAFVRLTR